MTYIHIILIHNFAYVIFKQLRSYESKKNDFIDDYYGYAAKKYSS